MSHHLPNPSPTRQHVPHIPNTRTCPCGHVLVFPLPLPHLEYQNASTRTRSGVRALLSTALTRRTRPCGRVLRVRDVFLIPDMKTRPQCRVFVSGMTLPPSHYLLPPRHPKHENATPVSRSLCLGCPCTLPTTFYHPDTRWEGGEDELEHQAYKVRPPAFFLIIQFTNLY